MTALPVRGDVRRVLEQVLAEQNEKCGLIQNAQPWDEEEILFCEPPAGFRSFNSFLVVSMTVIALFAPLMFGSILGIVYPPLVYLNAVWELIVVSLGLYYFRYQFWGYQVITSRRVAQVIPERNELLQQGKLIISHAKYGPVYSTHAARATANNDNTGLIDVIGHMDNITMLVKDFALAENILTSQIDKLTTECRKLLAFELKTVLDTPPTYLYFIICGIFLLPCGIFLGLLITYFDTLPFGLKNMLVLLATLMLLLAIIFLDYGAKTRRAIIERREFLVGNFAAKHLTKSV